MKKEEMYSRVKFKTREIATMRFVNFFDLKLTYVHEK